MYIIARMLLGFGILFAIVSGSSLIGELAYPKERAFMTSLFNASYFIGSILAAAISIRTTSITGNWGWRVPSLLQICPSLLQICTVLYVLHVYTHDQVLILLVCYPKAHVGWSARIARRKLLPF